MNFIRKSKRNLNSWENHVNTNKWRDASTCCSFWWRCFAARGRASISILFGRIFSLFFHKVSKVQTSNHVLRPEEKDRVDLQHRSKFSQNLTNEEKTLWKNSFEIWNLLYILAQLKGLVLYINVHRLILPSCQNWVNLT